jgi:hypothetical protein
MAVLMSDWRPEVNSNTGHHPGAQKIRVWWQNEVQNSLAGKVSVKNLLSRIT